MAELPDKVKRNRSKKWTLDEKMSLVDSVEKHYNVLFGKCNNEVTDAKKRQLWLQITDNVNSCSSSKRTVDKVRDQFRHIKSETKAKAAKLLHEKMRTGGGEIEALDTDNIEDKLATMLNWERRLIKLIGPEGVVGIQTGIDSSRQEKFDVKNTPILPEHSHQLYSEDFQVENEGCEIMDPIFQDYQSDDAQATENKENKPETARKPQQTQKRKMTDDLLDIQFNILHQLTRIADASEERNRLKKYKLGLSLDSAFPIVNE